MGVGELRKEVWGFCVCGGGLGAGACCEAGISQGENVFSL